MYINIKCVFVYMIKWYGLLVAGKQIVSQCSGWLLLAAGIVYCTLRYVQTSLCICGVFSHLYIHCSVQQPVTEGTAQCCPGDLSGGGRCSPAGMTVWPPFPYNWLPPLGQEGVSSQVMWTPRFSGVGRECLCLQQTLPVECLLQAQLLY